MIDLERKLTEALRGQAEEVTPDLDAAWAEQQRRQRRPKRRRTSVWIAPLAAGLVLLTSALLATQLNPAVAPAGGPPMPVALSRAQNRSLSELNLLSTPVRLTDFSGMTAYAFTATTVSSADGLLFCVVALPAGRRFGESAPQYVAKPAPCAPISASGFTPVRAVYVGEPGGPLPPGKVVYLVDPAVLAMRVADTDGNVSEARDAGRVGAGRLLLADARPGTTPIECWIS